MSYSDRATSLPIVMRHWARLPSWLSMFADLKKIAQSDPLVLGLLTSGLSLFALINLYIILLPSTIEVPCGPFFR